VPVGLAVVGTAEVGAADVLSVEAAVGGGCALVDSVSDSGADSVVGAVVVPAPK